MSASTGQVPVSAMPLDLIHEKIIHTWYANDCKKLFGTGKNAPRFHDAGEPPNSRILSLQEMKDEFQRYKGLWNKAKHSVKLQKMLDSAKVNIFKELDIGQVLAIGLEDLKLLSTWPNSRAAAEARVKGKDNDSKLHRCCSPGMHQLIFLTKLLEIVKPEHKSMDVFLQGPHWNKDEKDFVKSLGYEVIKDAEALQKVRNNKRLPTFLFAPHFEPKAMRCYFESSPFPEIYVGENLAYLYNSKTNAEWIAALGHEKYDKTIDAWHDFTDATQFEPIPRLDGESWEEGVFRWRA